MKKVLSLVFVMLFVTLLFSVAFAEIDLKAMTDSELEALIIAAQTELSGRSSAFSNPNVISDKNGLKWTISSVEMIQLTTYVKIHTIFENHSTEDVIINVNSINVNGWDIAAIVYTNISSGKKAKIDVTFDLTDADIQSPGEIKSIDFNITVINPSTFMVIDQYTTTVTP